MNRVLFATDSPWQEQKRYLERFRSLPFTKEEQDLFFYKNAADLLQLPV
jgi:predicted TIM-barrel fold metal-dependent hydrolase